MRAPWLFHGDPSSVGWRRGPPNGSAFVVFDPPEPLVQPSELDGPKVCVPEPVVDFLEADIFGGEGVRDTDPVARPTDAAVFTHASHFEMRRILEGRQRSG